MHLQIKGFCISLKHRQEKGEWEDGNAEVAVALLFLTRPKLRQLFRDYKPPDESSLRASVRLFKIEASWPMPSD